MGTILGSKSIFNLYRFIRPLLLRFSCTSHNVFGPSIRAADDISSSCSRTSDGIARSRTLAVNAAACSSACADTSSTCPATSRSR